MNSRLRSVGVVLAGGVGQRVGAGTPKQLVKLAGRTILEHTIALFEGSAEIDEVVVLMTPGYAEPVRELVREGGFHKVVQIVEGGATRTESTWRALHALGPQECNVLLHDAVRPLLEPRIITECVRALERHTAVEVAIASSDTVLVAGPGPDGTEIVADVLDRSRLRRAQTPQGFRLSVIRRAYELAMADPEFAGRPATDDCGVVLRYLPEVPIVLVPGSERNMKVTHPIDLSIAEQLLRPVVADEPTVSGVPDVSGVPAVSGVPDGYRQALAGKTMAVFGGDDELAALAAAHGARVLAFPRADDPEAVAKALAGAGVVDHVVHVADLPPGTLIEAAEEAVAAGCLGAINVARAAHPHLRESGGRLLLRTAAGDTSLAVSARAATTALARALAEEWAADGVRVGCVSARTSARACLDVLASGQTGQIIGT
ncbi:2-C-methyl-D-erythritol 4-phosphate cytidylyltransferase [Nonomuraea glycinis]|uniref:2-C-methyl-D-erythritol 4-phosphate cytidylyltransferase n=1 Tax=Nonomuraea glycinis TaxID=2047744 RepID=A0A918E5S3_9ACTN|nr:IspD/TarI family cytidylyltransferase [Nonomuraea glycinis]MCA2176011.1 2-C-methyl-D-erythritol 4-phosphate cytidylyltransferase [Nonomuraea glycinis]GGP05840.1 pyrophosphorylase [Nonomuraea glycinis]